MSTNTRRGFISGFGAGVAAFAGAPFGNPAFGALAGTNEDILISVFLRGGMDSLNLVLPIAGADRGYYEAARPELRVPTSGSNRALPLNAQLGIHSATHSWPSGTPAPPATLYELYQSGKLALVVAAGMHLGNRSHFDSMNYVELGTPGSVTTPTGWLTRHLASATNLPPEITIPSLAVGNLRQDSLRGSTDTLNMTSPDSFSLDVGPWQWRDAQRSALRNLYSSAGDWLHESGVSALDAVDIIELFVSGGYDPSNGAVYPSGTLGGYFQTVAQMIKTGLGLRVAAVDFGGWDTHNNQGTGGGGYFFDQVRELSRALAALYTDLNGSGANNYISRVTIVVQSEFGRRFRENADRGVDHGHGGLMMVLGGKVNGGVHGTWPGLSNDQLFEGADLEVTTDYRRVLSEILIRRLGNNHLMDVFPGYTDYSPLGVVQGVDLPPIYGPDIFMDGFETGDASRWSSSS